MKEWNQEKEDKYLFLKIATLVLGAAGMFTPAKIVGGFLLLVNIGILFYQQFMDTFGDN